MSLSCGFIGLGDQGAPIARRMIDSGLSVTLWARRAESLDPFRDTAGKIVNSIAELGAASDYVGICVLGDESAREVCTQLFPAMRPGSFIALHTTTHPDTAKELASKAASRGITLVDATVSGGSPAASAGTLTIMLGGPEAAIASIRPVLETFGGLIVRLGDVGAGQIAKLINNSLLGAHVALAHLVTKAGMEQGIDRAALLDLLQASSGNSFGLGVYSRQNDIAAFKHRVILYDQIETLGSVLGDTHPTFTTLRDTAARLFREQA